MTDPAVKEAIHREQIVPPLIQSGVPATEAERIYEIYVREVNAVSPPTLPPRPADWEWSEPGTSSNAGPTFHSL